MNWREDGEGKKEGERVRMNGGGGGWRVEGEGRTRRGDGGGVERQWKRIRENIWENVWIHMSAGGPRHQHCVKITCPIMKRDCSPFYPGCLPVHPVLIPPPHSLPLHIHPLYIFGCSHIASDNVIPENRLELFTVFYKDGLFCQYPMAG